MYKKLIGLGIAVVLLFSLAACNTDFDLAKYKTDAKAEIEAYAIESEFSSYKWTVVCDLVFIGKFAIDYAESKTDVDASVAETKLGINEIKMAIAELGKFDGLDPEIELLVIKTFFKMKYGYDYDWNKYDDYNPIGMYYGTFNNCVVVYCGGWSWGGWGFGLIIEEIIEGNKFYYPMNGVKIWKDDTFYSLQESYDQGFIKIEDLEQIAARMKEYHPGFYIDL